MSSRVFFKGVFLRSMRSRHLGVIVCLAVSLISLSCSRREETRTELQYPQPRYPRYLVNPNTDDLMKAARFAVRQPVGRSPLGKMQSGQTVHVFIQWGQDMRAWEAIRKAWAEKGVEAHAVGYWEIMGITKEEYDRRMEANAAHGNEGWKELGNFRVDYKRYFPEDIQKEFGEPITDDYLRRNYATAYLDKHPEIQYIYAGNGGGGFWSRAFGPKHGDKFQGNWFYLSVGNLLSKAAEFPADVWSLVDEKTLRPIPFVSEVTFQDPEGTNLHWTLSQEEAQRWGGSNGGSNHIFIYPNPLHSTLQEGAVLVAHANHTGVYPTMTIHVDSHGGIQSMEGGGRVGELFRMLQNHPDFKEAQFPKAPAKGYWFFRQDGFATNPKYVTSYEHLIHGAPWLPNDTERNRAGIQHLAFSYDSDDPEDLAYAKQRGLPLGNGEHTAHLHNYFPTVRWKLRDTGEWLAIAEKGYVKMFDDPEVRALASRYGDPDLIFRYEWIPSFPGINVPGDYAKDFAPDPWAWLMAEWKQIEEGTYQYFLDDYSLGNQQVAQNDYRP
ncbi:MAG: hypothetical protein HY649_11035 [Acidobacteria bacterium]|nr:hypothetical protein [Acidobacteriota bacterium]